MNIGEAIVLGVVQGLTEFLPVSSSAHLRIVPEALGWEDPGAAFTAVTQLGTLLAVLVYFRKDLMRIGAAVWRGLREPTQRTGADWTMGVAVAVGTVPIIVFGLLLKDEIETTFRNLQIIGVTLIVFGLIMEIADRAGKSVRSEGSIRVKDGLAVGLAQALALVPGVSRSGATISMARAMGFERSAAARFSFLLSIPAVVLSGVFEARHVFEGSLEAAPTAVATVIAFVTGYISIAWLLRLLQRHGLTLFTLWRVAVGVLVLTFLAG